MDFKARINKLSEEYTQKRLELNREYDILEAERDNLDYTDENVRVRWKELRDRMVEIRNDLEYRLPREYTEAQAEILDAAFDHFLKRTAS